MTPSLHSAADGAGASMSTASAPNSMQVCQPSGVVAQSDRHEHVF